MVTRLSTRHLGTCAACNHRIKVRSGRLVHHGYKRPGWGEIIGDCFGVGFEPNEVSPRLLDALIVNGQRQIAHLTATLNGLHKLESLTVPKQRFGYVGKNAEEITIGRDHPDFVWRLREREDQLRNALGRWQSQLRELDVRRKAWQPASLTTSEEAVAQEQGVREVRREAKRVQRWQKIDAKIGFYQKQIDSAARKRDPVRLKSLWSSATVALEALAGEGTEEFNQAWSRLDRDDVFAQIDEMTEELRRRNAVLIAKKVKDYQKQIDEAYRGKYTDSLIRLYLEADEELSQLMFPFNKYTYFRDGDGPGIPLLDRDYIWERLGLMVEGRYKSPRVWTFKPNPL